MQISEAIPDPRGDIRAMRNRSIYWHEALCELVDNSFDAGATRVDIEINKREATVTDDGCGCLDHNAMVQRGKHRHQKTTTIGRYGVGLKNVSAAKASILRIESNKGGQRLLVRVDWTAREKHGNWEYSFDVQPSTEKDGTKVKLEELRQLPPKLDEIVNQLSFTYAPRGERQITVAVGKNKRVVPAYQPPDMDHAVKHTGVIDGKRSYRVEAGVLRSGASTRMNGFIVAMGHRVIHNTFEPCGEYGGARFYGFVELIGDWSLSDHKTEIVDGGQDLWEELHRVCIEPLKKASAVSHNVEIAGLEESLSARLTEAFMKERKAVRHQNRDVIGTIKPKHTKRKHSKAARSQSGATFKERISRGIIKVKFDTFQNNSAAVIQDTTSCLTVLLNLSNEWVREHLNQKTVNSVLFYQFVASQLAAWWCLKAEENEDWRELLPNIRSGEGIDSYNEALASMLKIESTESISVA
jgi:hypothetical protein